MAAYFDVELRQVPAGDGFRADPEAMLAATVEHTAMLVMATLDGNRPADWEDRADELLDEMGLGDAGHLRPAQLSGGQGQRVGLARALIHQPRVILADPARTTSQTMSEVD